MLSEAKIKKLLESGTKSHGISDGRGLFFMISQAGNASFHFRYNFNGTRNKFLLGKYPTLTLKDARKLCGHYQQCVKDGIDPRSEKERERVRTLTTLNDVFSHYYDTNIQDRYKHPKRLLALYENNILGALGKMRITHITGMDVSALVQRIKKGGRGRSSRPTVSTDTLYLIKNLFRHAIKLDLVRHDPVAGFTARDAGGTENAKTHALSLTEIKTFFRIARERHPAFSRQNYLACILLFIVCVRKMELLASRWEEFDIEKRLWNLPASRTKSQRSLTIPLTALAITVLEELKWLSAGSEYVFPSLKRGSKLGHLYFDTLNHAVKHLPLPFQFTIHDIRRTARTLLASELGIDFRIAELCLNHKLKGIESVYNQYAYLEERRDALEQLSELIKKIFFSDEITGKKKFFVISKKLLFLQFILLFLIFKNFFSFFISHLKSVHFISRIQRSAMICRK